MEKKMFWVVPAVVLAFTIFGTSCQSTEPTNAASETITATANDESQVSATSDAVVSAAEQYTPSFSTSGLRVKSDMAEKISDSVSITVDRPDAQTFPKVVTIDYGTAGFVGKRGNILKGKMIVTISNNMDVVGSTKTITFDNFSVNGNALNGAKVITYKGNDSWTISANDTLTRVDGTVVTWSTERTRTRIDDNQTPLIKWDDTFAITGSSSGVNAKGKAYTMTIDEANPLIIGGGYPFFTKGKLTITTETKTIYLDYGNGTKDDLATVTVNGKVKVITLKK
jgi:hypothetical protein